MNTERYEIQAAPPVLGNLARDEVWSPRWWKAIESSSVESAESSRHTTVSQVHLDLGDPPTYPAISTGGFLPLLGDWRMEVEGSAEAFQTTQFIAFAKWHTGIVSNLSASPGWSPTFGRLQSAGFLVLDTFAALLCGAARPPADESLSEHSRKLAELLYDTRRKAASDFRAMAPAAASAPAIAAVPDPKVEPSPTAEAAREVRGNLGWSDGQLARLFGLSRQGWRDWVRGSATPRPKNRKRLYFLRQLLLVRATVAPNARPSVWFESPIAAGRAETPADLFQTGRDALVAALAAAGPTPESGTYMLDRGLELGGLVNTKAAEAAMLEAAAISSEDRA